MHGEYDPAYIYGFIDCDYGGDFIFYDEDLQEYGVELFADSLVRLNMRGAIYGISIPFTKKATIEQKKQIKDVIEKLKLKYDGVGKIKIGYFLGIKGYDWEIPHKKYKLKDEEINIQKIKKEEEDKQNMLEFDTRLINYLIKKPIL